MSRRSLSVEALEARETPATFGNAWPDGQHLTVSFAPQATAITNGSGTALTAAQQLQVLTAIQNWAVPANLNIGLVGDTGAPFGTSGPVQGDPRFGDIRVGATNLAPDVLAVTAPYNLMDNYSGDVVVNSSAYSPGGPDLYTVMLQETGHALSVGNSPDPGSVMYEYYRGPRSGLSAGDITSIQSLYGPRQPDAFEGSNGNDTLTTATRYSSTLTADLTTTNDVDAYKFTGALFASRATITLHAYGISLVTPQVQVFDSRGRLITSALTTDPTNNDLTLTLNSVSFGSTYYVRVSSARSDVFGVGAYQLDIQQKTLLGSILGGVGSLLDDTGLNDTLQSAVNLLTNSNSVDATTEYGVDGSFSSSSDVDDYRIVVPPSSGPVNLLVTMWGKNGAPLSPWVKVYDALGNPLSAQILTADGTTTTLQVAGLSPGSVYFLSASSDVHMVGDYHLAADLRATSVAFDHGGSGTLTADQSVAAASFYLPQTNQVHFVLQLSGSAGSGDLVVIAPDGSVATQFTVLVGRARSIDLFLPAGQYRIEVRGNSSSAIQFQLGLNVVTDPTGATPTDPTSSPQQPPPPTSPPPPPADSGNTAPPPPVSPPPPDPSVSPSDPDPDDAYWY